MLCIVSDAALNYVYKSEIKLINFRLFSLCRLSGLSPFMGDSDVETFANITRADYDFDDEAFDCVSQQAKDFISNLLVHRKEDRWSAEECLESPWLKPGRYDENLATTKICTDKLKKFIIRRKWQVGFTLKTA